MDSHLRGALSQKELRGLQPPHASFENQCDKATGELPPPNAFVYFGSLSYMNEFAKLTFPVKLSLVENTAIIQVM